MNVGKATGEKCSTLSKGTIGDEQKGVRELTDGPESVEPQDQPSNPAAMQELGRQVDKRWALRRHIEIDAILTDSVGLVFSVKLTNISEEGCAIRTTSSLDLARNSTYSLKVTGLAPLPCHPVWSFDDKTGLAFREPLHPAIVQNLVMKSLHSLMIMRMAQPDQSDNWLGSLPPFPFD